MKVGATSLYGFLAFLDLLVLGPGFIASVDDGLLCPTNLCLVGSESTQPGMGSSGCSNLMFYGQGPRLYEVFALEKLILI